MAGAAWRDGARVSDGEPPVPFDPRALLATLEAHRVDYVVIGGMARIVRGTDELTDALDVCPSVRPQSLARLERALAELDATHADGERARVDEAALFQQPAQLFETRYGRLQLVPEPAGTRNGYDDLRRGATREHLGHGLRPQIASVPDLARMAAALGRETDRLPLRELRRISEIEPHLQRSLGFGRDL